MDEAFTPAGSVTGRPLARSARPHLHWSLGGDSGRSGLRRHNGRPHRQPQGGARLLARTRGVVLHPHSMAWDPEYRAELARVMRYLLIESRSAQARRASVAALPVTTETMIARARRWVATQFGRPAVGLPIAAGLLATAAALIFL